MLLRKEQMSLRHCVTASQRVRQGNLAKCKCSGVAVTTEGISRLLM